MLVLNEGHGRGMDYPITYLEVQEPLAKVSGNRRHSGRQEYSWNIEPKTSLIQLQLVGMWLNPQYIQE